MNQDERPPCTKWNGERCTMERFGGTPSAGVCRICDDYDGPARGLGDTVERLLDATGIGGVVKAVAGSRDCGCSRRRTRLNELTSPAQPSREI